MQNIAKQVILIFNLFLILSCEDKEVPQLNFDCNDIAGGTATIDDCGLCTGGNTGLEANYLKDCAGVCGGSALVDECG